MSFATLSMAERDRRYAAVRERMRACSVDVIVVRADSSKWDSGSADARYLTQIGANGEEGYVVFDLKEDPVFVVWGAGQISHWREAQAWTTDIRPMLDSAERVVAGRIKELALELATIGIVGLGGGPGLYRQGKWPHIGYERLRQEVPNGRWIDFELEFAAVKTIKSAEEIACHERAARLADDAVEAMYRVARAGVRIPTVVAAMAEALIAGGSEMPPMLLFTASPAAVLAGRLLPDRPLARGDVLLTEITGRVTGSCAQVHQPAVIGAPAPHYTQLFDLAREGLRASERVARPGVSVHELAAAIRAPMEAQGVPGTLPAFKGIGLSINEFPMCPPPGTPVRPDNDVRLAENMVLTFEPMAYDPRRPAGIHLAATYVVTREGCRRLSTRDPDLRVL